MRKFSYLMLVLALVLPMALPFGIAVAQDDPTIAAMEAYTTNLPPRFGNISMTDLSVRMIEEPDLFLLDVRQPEEYAEGHLPGAINIPIRELAQNLDLLPPQDEQFVVYCGTSFRSAIAMTALHLLGYDVLNMEVGFGGWAEEDFPTSTEGFEAVAGEMPDIDPVLLADVDAGLAGLPDGWGAIRADALNIELIENPPDLFIDARTPDERAGGYIIDSVHMPLADFTSYIDDLPEDMDADIIVYCQVGHRGNMASQMLRTLGYTNVRNLAGGFNAWVGAEFAVEMAE